MRAFRSLSQAAVIAMLFAMQVARCAGAAPSLSVINLPTGGSVMTADAQGNIFLTGVAVGLPVTSGAAQGKPGGGTCILTLTIGLTAPVPCYDAFIAKMRADTGALIYATYLGGNMNDFGTGIAFDTAGNVYVTGTTGGGFPTTPHAFMPSPATGVFVAKLNPDGSQFLYSTYLPGVALQPWLYRKRHLQSQWMRMATPMLRARPRRATCSSIS